MIELPAALVPLFAAWSALVGAAVGSFLNVLIARVPAGESIVRPGSRCPRCKTPIRWYDNLPVVSWLLLRARCRARGARISARHPLVGGRAPPGAGGRGKSGARIILPHADACKEPFTHTGDVFRQSEGSG